MSRHGLYQSSLDQFLNLDATLRQQGERMPDHDSDGDPVHWVDEPDLAEMTDIFGEKFLSQAIPEII